MKITAVPKDSGGATITIRDGLFELNIHLTEREVLDLPAVASARWKDRGSMALGRCAGARVFWCTEADSVLCILVGNDDETWDFGVTLGKDGLQAILGALPWPEHDPLFDEPTELVPLNPS